MWEPLEVAMQGAHDQDRSPNRQREPVRGAGSPSPRRAYLMAAGGAGMALLVAAGLWMLLGDVAPRAGDPVSVVSRVEAWLLERWRDRLAAPQPEAAAVTFEIVPGEGLASVAQRLAGAGLIRDERAFLLLARTMGLDRSVQAGTHTLRADMSAEEVLRELQTAPSVGVTVTIPEGLRVEEVAALLAGHAVADREELLLAAMSPERTGRALSDLRPAEAGLEGYLFPDTYAFTPDSPAAAVVGRMLDAFEARFAPAWSTAAYDGLSVHDVVIVASIVEREAVLEAERPRIARVFLNRLAEPPYLLNADPTVQYGLGFQPEAGTWWKRPLLTADLAADSPYNSYTRPGLPPGPIASPGLASLQSVLQPADGAWQYFVADERACDGSHVFAVTYDEHLRNVAAYRTGGCGP